MTKFVNYRGQKYEIKDDEVYLDDRKYTVIHTIDDLKQCFKETTKFKGLENVEDKQCCLSKGSPHYAINFEVYLENFNKYKNTLLIFNFCIFLKKVTLKESFGDITHKLDTSFSSNVPSMAFYNNSFEDEVVIEYDNIEDKNLSFIFKHSHFQKKLKIRNGESRLTSSYKGNDSNSYACYQNTKLKLNKLHITDCTSVDNSYLRIGFVEVTQFILSDLRLSSNTELNIGDCFFHNFRISNFRNTGKFKLYKINNFSSEEPIEKIENKEDKSLPTTFQIDNTSIGKTDFQSVHIDSFEEIKMFDNIFTELDYTNITWGDKDIKVGQYDDDSNKGTEAIELRKLRKQQDTYRTLKNVASKNNDQPQALVFYQKEMSSHAEVVIKGRCQKEDFTRFFVKDIFCKKQYWLKDKRMIEIVTLYFNKKTNEFGLNWWRPIWILLLFTIFMYIVLLYVLSVPVLELSVNIWDNINMSKFFARFFIFLNPIHKVKDVFGGDWGGLAYAIDFIFRIGEGLLIYQTTQAFRKYSRKL